MREVKRHRTVVDESPLARRIGERIRMARTNAGMTQLQLAEGRYTKAYISALEKGHAKPSVAALNFIAERLHMPAAYFLGGVDVRWSRLEADLLLASGQWQEAEEAYDALLASTNDRLAMADLLRGKAEALCRLGRGMEAIKPAAESVDIFQSAHRDHDAILAGYWLAYANYLAENTAEARAILRMLLDRARSGMQIDPDLEMRLLTAASYVEAWEGKHQAAVAYLEEARALSADLDGRRRAAFLSALATAYFSSGDVEAAVKAGNQSLALFHSFDADHEAALVANNLANAYLAIGNLARASELVAEARREQEGTRGGAELANVLDTEARIELARGDTVSAIDLAGQAVETAEATENKKALTDALVTMARAAAQAGKPDEAREHYERAVALLREHGPQASLAEVLGELADLLASRGDHEKAYKLTREALGRPAGA
jgi:tetratricopeptide (TPR) repeat protein